MITVHFIPHYTLKTAPLQPWLSLHSLSSTEKFSFLNLLNLRLLSDWLNKSDSVANQSKFLSIKLNKGVVTSSHRCPSTRWQLCSSPDSSVHTHRGSLQLRNNHTGTQWATSCGKAPWVIKVLITLHIFMDTIKNKTAIKKIADCRAKSPKDPISSWSTWWTHWQADCFPVPIFGACEKWSAQPVCGLRWVINLVLSPPWW